MPLGTGSVQDELLRTGGSTNQFQETVTADATSAAVYYGPGVLAVFRLIVSAASGTNPTLDSKMQLCTSANGDGALDAGSFPQQTEDQVAAYGTVTEAPTVSVRTTAARPYVRVVHDVGGTTPSFTVAVLHSIVQDAAI